ncbi:hypothetical protein AVEN_119268-1, partial [Araneus ventricosus]
SIRAVVLTLQFTPKEARAKSRRGRMLHHSPYLGKTCRRHFYLRIEMRREEQQTSLAEWEPMPQGRIHARMCINLDTLKKTK